MKLGELSLVTLSALFAPSCFHVWKSTWDTLSSSLGAAIPPQREQSTIICLRAKHCHRLPPLQFRTHLPQWELEVKIQQSYHLQRAKMQLWGFTHTHRITNRTGDSCWSPTFTKNTFENGNCQNKHPCTVHTSNSCELLNYQCTLSTKLALANNLTWLQW